MKSMKVLLVTSHAPTEPIYVKVMALSCAVCALDRFTEEEKNKMEKSLL